jgi:hypothetical protein
VTDAAWQGEFMKLARRADSKIKLRTIKWEDTNSAGLTNSLVVKILDVMHDDVADKTLHGLINDLRKIVLQGHGTRRFSLAQHLAQLANIIRHYCWLTKNPRTE